MSKPGASQGDPPESAYSRAMTRRGIAAGVVVLGIVLMVVASVRAPPQPEFLYLGGSCEIAPCGELEDPARWHAAWLVWWPGAVLAVLGAVGAARAMQPPHWAKVLLIAVLAPCWTYMLLFPAYAVSLFTSAHGAWTTLVLGAALPCAYHLSSIVLWAYESQRAMAAPGRGVVSR